MKKMLLIPIFLLLISSLFSGEPVKPIQLTKEIVIVDSITKELLAGVKVNDSYSDFNGKATIKTNDNVNISFISYKTMIINKIKSDTIYISPI